MLPGADIVEECCNGHYGTLCTFQQAWGRVGETALSALCLEVYYSYAVLDNK